MATPKTRAALRRQFNISKRWGDILDLIPGYDCLRVDPKVYVFDEDAADEAIDFFHECCQHVKGEKGGQAFLLEPWQQAFTGAIYGWKHRADGTRRYREVLLYVPRKNGKTPWAAGIVLKTMMGDPEPGIEAYSAASDTDQAALVYQYVNGMIQAESLFKENLKVYTATKVVEYLARFAYYKVLSGIPDSKHGLNVHLGIIDETHAHKAPDLMDVIMTGTAARRQPLIIHTTTADFMRESICNEKYEYGCKVRDGILNDAAFLPIIYEAVAPKDEEADALWWTSPAVWKHANPNYGISVKPEYLERECQRAIDQPRLRNTFKRLHLNIRTGQEDEWFGMELWDSCYDGTVQAEELQGLKCYAGVDLASTWDLNACVLWFPEVSALLPFFWLPRLSIQRKIEQSRVAYDLWVDQGYIKVTGGNVTDYDVIRADINRLNEQYNIQEIAIDRHDSTQMQTQLMGDGFEVVPFGQGYLSMSAPSKELERRLMGKQLRHGGDPVLRWMASVVAIETDAAGNIKPSKGKSTDKIDGIVALVMALGRAMVADDSDDESVYEKRGILVL